MNSLLSLDSHAQIDPKYALAARERITKIASCNMFACPHATAEKEVAKARYSGT